MPLIFEIKSVINYRLVLWGIVQTAKQRNGTINA